MTLLQHGPCQLTFVLLRDETWIICVHCATRSCCTLQLQYAAAVAPLAWLPAAPAAVSSTRAAICTQSARNLPTLQDGLAHVPHKVAIHRVTKEQYAQVIVLAGALLGPCAFHYTEQKVA
jgi:hypothetical protein